MRYDGFVTWGYGDLFSTTCSLDMSTFPFDTQECIVIYGNLGSTMDHVAFNPSLNHFSKAQIYDKSEEFYVKTSTVTYTEQKAANRGRGSCALYFRLLLKRQPLYHIMNIIVPCGLMACVSLLSFILPPASGERISLQVTAMLSLAVYQLTITGLVPVTSKNTPVMSKFVQTNQTDIEISA